MKLRDQVAIVTGAGRNIGEEIAKLFAAEGAAAAPAAEGAAAGKETGDKEKAGKKPEAAEKKEKK